MIRYGVVVGRFQVADLHPGHLSLLDHVRKHNDRMIIFVAVTRTSPTNRNPLDFESRRRMLYAEFPESVVVPIRDERSDEVWSGVLDSKIAELTERSSDVMLYGGPDSFLNVYKGVHSKTIRPVYAPYRVGEKMLASGSNQRNDIARTVKNTSDWRAGIIHGIANQYPRVYVTVDCAVMYRRVDGGVDVLLGKKKNEDLWRFPGGFLNQGESLEKAVKREVYEETTMDLQNVEFVGSFPVDDWRYRNDPDAKITTCFHIAWASSYGAKAGDDLEKVQWFPAEQMPRLVGEHKMLCEQFKKIVNTRFYYDSDDPTNGRCEGEDNAKTDTVQS